MKLKAITFFLLLTLLLLGGCDKNTPAPKYFEIVTDDTTFHEIIVVSSGEVFEKIGKSNLDFENQVKTSTMQKENATILFDKSKELAQKGTDCEFGKKEIIIFENNTVIRKCFTSTDFDSFFNEVKTEIIGLTNTNNFFIHLITYENGKSVDRHLHSDGLLISTFYTMNKMTSAQVKTLSTEKINQLKQLTNNQLFIQEPNCSPSEANYNYIEVQNDSNYIYYHNCEKNSTTKSTFFNEVLLRLGE